MEKDTKILSEDLIREIRTMRSLLKHRKDYFKELNDRQIGALEKELMLLGKELKETGLQEIIQLPDCKPYDATNLKHVSNFDSAVFDSLHKELWALRIKALKSKSLNEAIANYKKIVFWLEGKATEPKIRQGGSIKNLGWTVRDTKVISWLCHMYLKPIKDKIVKLEKLKDIDNEKALQKLNDARVSGSRKTNDLKKREVLIRRNRIKEYLLNNPSPDLKGKSPENFLIDTLDLKNLTGKSITTKTVKNDLKMLKLEIR